jgi:hypothetical protein
MLPAQPLAVNRWEWLVMSKVKEIVSEIVSEIVQAQPDDSSFDEILRELAFSRMR